MAYCKILLPDGVTELANIKSVTFREAVNGGVDLRPGCVGSASIEVEVFNTQPNAVNAGDALTYYQIDKNNTQTLIGVFYAEPVIATKNSYKFVAYDAAQKLNADFSAWLMANQSNFPMTIYALVSAACTVAGVTLGSASWPLSTQNVQAFYADGLTCRDILSYAAELGCKFVRCHSDGNVYFDWYATATNKRIYPSAGTSGSETRYAYKQDGLQYTNYTTAALDGVAVHPSGEDDVAYIYPTSASGNLLNITNNLLLTGADAALFNAAAQNIYTELSAVGAYRPTTANLFPRENPFRAGDVVAVTDAQAVSFTTVIMEQTVNESDAVLSSTGNEYYSEDGNTQKALTQLASDVVRINKLKVDWADINTAIINYLTANDVTAQNLTIVDANDNVLATFNANGITLGQTDEAHAELDFNSFILKDKDGKVYFSVGDERDVNGEVVVSLNYTGNGSQTSYELNPIVPNAYQNTVVVTVGGTPVSNYSIQGGGSQIVFTSAPASNSAIVISYTTDRAFYHYDIGVRASGSNIGTNSTVLGANSTASAPGSISGGYNNKASGYASVALGKQSEATNDEASAIGLLNKANGRLSFAGGGQGNQANAVADAIVGGFGNQTSGGYSAVVGGYQNEATGGGAVVLGGRENKASGLYSVVHGKYNIEDTTNTYAEIVGNGTADNARSNARTLDWSGNETLAGGLTLGVPLAITDGGTGATTAQDALLNLKGLDLDQGKAIPSNSDLNNYTTPGSYYVLSSTEAATITNGPTTATGYKLVVMVGSITDRRHQFAFEQSTNTEYRRYFNGSSWGPWELTLITTERGSSGNWRWVKRNDGTCDLYYQEASYTADLSTAKGSIFVQSSQHTLTYPFTVYRGTASVTFYYNSNAYITWATQIAPFQSTLYYRLACCSSIASLSGTFTAHVAGYWRNPG